MEELSQMRELRFSRCTFLWARKMTSKEQCFPGQESPQMNTKGLPGHMKEVYVHCGTSASAPAPQKSSLLEPWEKALCSGPLPAR